MAKASTKKESNNLTVSFLKKQAKDNNKMETYEFTDGKELKFHPVFPPKKIKELQKDLQSILQEIEAKNAESEDEKIIVDEEYMFDLVNFLCVKHFTGLKRSISDGLINTIEFMNALADTDHYKEMLDEMFPQKELKKVVYSLGDAFGKNVFMMDVVSKAQETYVKLENADVFKELKVLDNQK